MMNGIQFQSVQTPNALSSELRSVIRDNVLQFYVQGNRMDVQEEGITALYERLSQEDKLDGESTIFLATGQDAAHVVEGSLGITTAENRNGDLYFSVNLPDLPVATVGGGTSLEVAHEGLEILGVAGSNHAREFAEIVASTVLAGELSLVGALAAGHLARAHQELGRG